MFHAIHYRSTDYEYTKQNIISKTNSLIVLNY